MALGSSKPVCYYQFENNANDTSNAGNGMNGTLVAPGTFSTTEKIRGSYSYLGTRTGGSSTIHSCGTAADLAFIHSGVFTISWWTKRSNASTTGYVMGTNAASGGTDWFAGYVGTTIRFKRYSGSPSDQNNNSNATVASTNTDWHHVVITCDASTMQFYVDGSLDKSITSGGWPGAGTPSNPLMLGSVPYSTYPATLNSFVYRGYLDEVSFWDATATAEDAASLYNDGSPYDLSDGLQGGLPSGIKNAGGISADSVKTVGGISADSIRAIMGVA